MLRRAIELQTEVGCNDIGYLPDNWQKELHKSLENAAEINILRNIN